MIGSTMSSISLVIRATELQKGPNSELQQVSNAKITGQIGKE